MLGLSRGYSCTMQAPLLGFGVLPEPMPILCSLLFVLLKEACRDRLVKNLVEVHNKPAPGLADALPCCDGALHCGRNMYQIMVQYNTIYVQCRSRRPGSIGRAEYTTRSSC